MTLQNSGTSISFSQIENEFGSGGVANETRRLGKYRRDDPGFRNKNVGEMTNMPLDTDGNFPTSGQIKFSDFYGKQLNVIISYDSNQNNPPSGSSKFDNNNEKTVVGGFKSASSVTSSQGKRVTLHVHNGVFLGSQQGTSTSETSKYKSALITGEGWETDTELDINIAGVVCGGGGNGGQGSEDPSNIGNGTPGLNGNSAIGISYPVETLTNNGFIRAGAGGGGGGGSGKEDSETEDRRGGGGGGGGGAGIPAGAGGLARSHGSGPFAVGGNGAAGGGPNEGGNGGGGGNQGNEAFGGGGGGGGAFVSGGQGSGGPDGGESEGPQPTAGSAGGTNGNGGGGGKGGRADEGERSSGGSGGQPGYSIIRTNNATYNLVNNGDLRGSQTNVAGNVSGDF